VLPFVERCEHEVWKPSPRCAAALSHHRGEPRVIVLSKDASIQSTDVVFAEIDLPPRDGDWHNEIRQGAASTRGALRRHPWALGPLESRKTPGPATLRHHDTMIGTLRAAGFSVEATAHAYALIDSYVYGFALQEAALPFDGPETVADGAEPMIGDFDDGEYPHLKEMATDFILQPGYDFGHEFEIGLNLILDALTRSLPPAKRRRPPRPS
jgi:Tetracyclin repressor-like, C-terminal domain